jgi:hypothetical protein
LVNSGFKRGGVDHRLDYYGDSKIGLMSKEMYHFNTGQFYKSLDEATKVLSLSTLSKTRAGSP